MPISGEIFRPGITVYFDAVAGLAEELGGVPMATAAVSAVTVVTAAKITARAIMDARRYDLEGMRNMGGIYTLIPCRPELWMSPPSCPHLNTLSA
jgi:hypothetical protein